MIKCFLMSFILSAPFAPIVLSQKVTEAELQEAFKFSNVVISSIDEYIRDALPTAAKTEGDKILQNVREGLVNCESFGRTSQDIGQYKACSSSLLGNGMAALGALQAKYRPLTSGASRMSLFL